MEDMTARFGDLGDGTYRNPILYADYSDPDVVRVGEDYFMVASSFTNTPAIPLLHSKDLVNWKVVNYVLETLPFDRYETPQHGCGVWAPAIRYHDNKFWVCFPMPDEGLFFSTATDPFGQWSEPFPLREGAGWIDPAPFWDDDGKAYMVSAFAASRIGFNSILNLAEMKPDGTGLIDDGKHIFDGYDTQPTIEGPKMYKRGEYYYILAPAGGVKHGWQTALRSKNVWGPYEEKIVMFRGGGPINGPHQGALIDTPDGDWWFIHFQDAETAGRIVHLQPVSWEEDWPIIGKSRGNAFCGEPVIEHEKPKVGKEYPAHMPEDSDDFTQDTLGLQWQWNANYKDDFYSLGDNGLTLHAKPRPEKLSDAPNLLLQKFPAPFFEADTTLDCTKLEANTEIGLVVLARDYGALAIEKTEEGLALSAVRGEIFGDNPERKEPLLELGVTGTLGLKLVVEHNICDFYYSVDGLNYVPLFSFETSPGVWVGAKAGLYCTGDAGSLVARNFFIEKY